MFGEVRFPVAMRARLIVPQMPACTYIEIQTTFIRYAGRGPVSFRACHLNLAVALISLAIGS